MEHGAASIAIIIPTLNAARGLRHCLQALKPVAPMELLVVDGGSTDETRAIAAAEGARVLMAERGRGTQLAAGAAEARADWLLFLHADTVLAAGVGDAIRRFLARETGARAGYFAFALDDASPAARRLERAVAWRCRILALPYGDQGLLIGRTLYAAVGGFKPLPLMEDVDLVRRLGRNRLVPIDHRAVTSAERYRRSGYLKRGLRNLACLALYFLGVPPTAIQRIYR